MKTGSIRLTGALLCLVLCAAALFGCSAMKDEKLESACRTFLDAVMDEGKNASAYALLPEGQMTEEDFSEGMTSIREHVGPFTTYTLRATGWNKEYKDGVQIVSATYLVKTNGENFYAEVTRADAPEGIRDFRVTRERDVAFTGTVWNMNDASPLSWVLLAFSVLSAAFIIWMLVDCIRRKLETKWLWCLLVLLQAGGSLHFTFDRAASFLEDISASFRVGVLGFFSYFATNNVGGVKFCLYLPIGAVIYFFLRKALSRKYEEKLAASAAASAGTEVRVDTAGTDSARTDAASLETTQTNATGTDTAADTASVETTQTDTAADGDRTGEN